DLLDDGLVSAMGARLRQRVLSTKQLPRRLIDFVLRQEPFQSTRFESTAERQFVFREAVLTGEVAIGETVIRDHCCPECGEQKFDHRLWVWNPRLRRDEAPVCRTCWQKFKVKRHRKTKRIPFELPENPRCVECRRLKKQRRQWPLRE